MYEKVKIENELRRGNHINGGKIIGISGGFVTLSGCFNISGMTSIDFDKLNPTKIDKDWLKRFDFEYVGEISQYANKHHCIAEGNDGEWIFQPFCTTDKDCYIKIKYVHELQNICYDFTKEELEN